MCGREISLLTGFGYKSGLYRGADKSLAQPGKKQAAPVRSVMGRGID